MNSRTEVFPHVIEMNYQARRRLGCCVYLVHDQNEWMLIDIGYDDTLDDIVRLIRGMDFPLANCRYLVATHADVDHIQALKRARELMPNAKVVGHPHAAKLLAEGERIETYAEIAAQGISLTMEPIQFDSTIDEGDVLQVGEKTLDVWHTPGHAPAQLSFRMGDLLFSGDNIYRDGCVGNIDAHHGSGHPRLHPLAAADQGERREVAPAEPRTDLPQGRCDAPEDDRSPRPVPAHGRLRNLRRRLAAA